MKTSRIYNLNGNSVFNWTEVMNEAKGFRYVVMYRDHYQGNGKGEWFNTEDFAQLFEGQNFWFVNSERPVYQVILTNDEVPEIIARRRELIDAIQRVEFDLHYLHIPMRPNCDGRATRRTQPEAFAEWDKAIARASRRKKQLNTKRANLKAALEAVQPYYSTTLYNIKAQ